MANDNLKKPANDNNVSAEEKEEKKKKIIILIILTLIVLALLIGTAWYFSGKEKEDDTKKPNDKQQEVKPKVDENLDNSVNNNTNTTVTTPKKVVYRPAKQEPVETPSVPTTITNEPNETIQVTQNGDELVIEGYTKYVAKVNNAFESEFNNIVQVKVYLNSKYTLDDLENMDFVVTSEIINNDENAKANYFLDVVRVDENGNLYFYWMQAVGKGLPMNPKLTINYGDGTVESYTMNLENLAVLVPVQDELLEALVSKPEGALVIGGANLDLSYKMTTLDDILLKDLNQDGATTIAEDDTQGDNTIDTNLKANTDTEVEDKDFTLKFTDVKKIVDPLDSEKLGYKDRQYIVAVRLYAPEDWVNNALNLAKISLEKTHIDGELKIDQTNSLEKVSFGNNTLNDDGSIVQNIFVNSEITTEEVEKPDGSKDTVQVTRYYIIVTMAADADYSSRPYVSIDWDGIDSAYGKYTYYFDFSDYNYESEEIESNGDTSEDGTNHLQTGATTNGIEGADANSSNGSAANNLDEGDDFDDEALIQTLDLDEEEPEDEEETTINNEVIEATGDSEGVEESEPVETHDLLQSSESIGLDEMGTD